MKIILSFIVAFLCFINISSSQNQISIEGRIGGFFLDIISPDSYQSPYFGYGTQYNIDLFGAYSIKESVSLNYGIGIRNINMLDYNPPHESIKNLQYITISGGFTTKTFWKPMNFNSTLSYNHYLRKIETNYLKKQYANIDVGLLFSMKRDWVLIINSNLSITPVFGGPGIIYGVNGTPKTVEYWAELIGIQIGVSKRIF